MLSSSLLNTISLAVLGALGQEGAAPPGGAAAPQAGSPPAGGQGGAGPGGFGGILIPLVLCFLVFYLLVILPERKKQKNRLAMIKQIKKGDQVVTTSGILGKVMKTEDHEIVLQVDRENDVRIRFLRSAIHEVIPEPGSQAEAKEAAASKEGAQ